MIGRNDLCWCGSGKKWKKCCSPKAPPEIAYKQLSQQYWNQYKILIKNEEQIEGIRKSSKLAAKALQETCAKAKEGITTNALNDFADEFLKQAGAVPASLGYGKPPFPKSICTSLNEVICHGIPDDRALQEDDICNIDIACILDGFYGDCSAMIIVGETSEERKTVVDISYKSLMAAIEICKPGALVSDIGEAIERVVAGTGCSIVRDFVGHGVGINYHENPQIPHCRNRVHIPLAEGMTFTIEPMINGGVVDGYVDPLDNWTVRTVDGKPSAQWEHTVLITHDDCEILTIV